MKRLTAVMALAGLLALTGCASTSSTPTPPADSASASSSVSPPASSAGDPASAGLTAVNASTVSALANLLWTAASTGGQAATADDTLTATDGFGATMTAPMLGAVILVDGAPLTTSTFLNGDSVICVSLNGFRMASGDSGPAAGADCQTASN
jgi:hypothetical protein